VEILASARKHGISDDDIRHVVNNAIGAVTSPEQPDFTMLVGPDVQARLVEVGMLSTDESDYVIHAMPVRQKYLSKILRQRGDTR
jgi:hypothetical protein